MHLPLPSPRLVLLLLAVLLIGACRSEPETDAPANAPEAHPEAAAYLVRAQKALEAGAYSAALALADSAEGRAAASHTRFLADVSFLRGHIYTELSRPDEVRAAYERTLTLTPDYRGAHLNLGNLAFRQQRYETALGHYRREAARYSDPQTLVLIGRAHQELGRSDSAQVAFEAAIDASDDTLAEAHARLAVLTDTGGDFETALVHIRRARELEQDNTDYAFYEGALLTRMGRTGEAVPLLARVVDARPTHQQAHYNLGLALGREGESTRSRRHLAVADSLQQLETDLTTWETRTRLQPDNSLNWATLAYAYSRLGRFEEAVRAYRIALHLDPTHPDFHYALANLLLERGDVEAALGRYEAALRQDSSYVDAWVNAGVAHIRAGRPDAARRAWETALRQDPDHPAARTYLERVTRQ